MQTPNFYIKDVFLSKANISKENITMDEDDAQVHVTLGSGGRHIADRLYESTLCGIIILGRQDNYIYRIEAHYNAIVELDSTPDNIDDILEVIVPQEVLFNPLRNYLYISSKECNAMPVMLTDETFSGFVQSRSEKKEEEYLRKEYEIVPVHDYSFEWLLGNMKENASGASLLHTIEQKLGRKITEWADTPQFRYFYLFFSHHPCCLPDYITERCGKGFDLMLYNLIFGECDNVQLTDTGLLPDLLFSWHGKDYTLSKIPQCKFDQLIEEIWAQSFTLTCHTLLDIKPHEMVLGEIDFDKLTYDDLCILYNCFSDDADPIRIDFAKRAFSRIEHCNSITQYFELLGE